MIAIWSIELVAVLEKAGNAGGVEDAADDTVPRLERAERTPLPKRTAVGEPVPDENQERPDEPTAIHQDPGAKRIVLETEVRQLDSIISTVALILRDG